MDFKESCNLHILSLSFVWYSCSFYLIMLWVGGGLKEHKQMQQLLTNLPTLQAISQGYCSFQSSFSVFLPYLPHRTQHRSYRDGSENLSSDLLREFSTRNISIHKQGVCLLLKQTYCYFIIIIICYFNCIAFHLKDQI